MEATALSLAKCVLDGVLAKATDVIGSELSLLEGVRPELSFIRDELEMMHAFLRAAAARGQERNEVVRTWVKQVQDLAYDVEDTLDQLVLHLRRDSWLRLPSTLARRHQVAAKIQAIKARVEEVSQRNLRYHLINDTSAGASAGRELGLAATAAVQEARLIGREEIRTRITQLLSAPEENLRVVAVWGMGGLGKTSLVRDIYNDVRDMYGFKRRVWATLLHPFSLVEVARDLARQLYVAPSKKDGVAVDTIRRISMMSMEELRHVVTSQLSKKKYVVVLDDVSAEEEWNGIKDFLPTNVEGSRIVVTTRVESVATHCCDPGLADHVMKLDVLPYDYAHKLFCTKVFGSPSYDAQSKVMEPVKAILDECDGLPLAIVTVAGFLATLPSTQWQNVRHHLGTEVASNPKLEKVRAVLTSSYDSLPYHLKSCFLYMSIFPRNKEIKKTLLVRRWIAEGFVKARRGATEEEVGESYFTELISRSMIQPSRTATLINGCFNNCQVHDMMLNISVSQSTEENLVTLLDKESSIATKDAVRHLVITDGWDRPQKGRAMRSMNVANNRSLVVYGEWKPYFLSWKMDLLRVLDLEGVKGLKDQDLEEIGRFRHLCYLGLRGTDITQLPKSMSKLVNLQTLDIRGTWVTRLTNTIIMLQHLRYLRAARPYRIKVELLHEGGWCAGRTSKTEVPIATEMPAKTSSSIRRHKIDPFGVKVPQGIGNLSTLHTLGVIDVGRGKSVARELSNLTQLRKLSLTGILSTNREAVFKAVSQLQHLQSLALQSQDPDDVCLNYNLSEMSSATTLLSLKLLGKLNMLPQWVTSLNNLYKLHLRGTTLSSEQLLELGKLPNLAILLILQKSFKGLELSFPSGWFSNLKRLGLVEQTLQRLTFHEGSARQLEHLLIVFPGERYEVHGVEHLHNLKHYSENHHPEKLDLGETLRVDVGYREYIRE